MTRFVAGLLACICLIPAASGQQEFQYPIAIAVHGDERFVVDLDLPGIWRIDADGKKEVHVQGSKRIREPLNRPRCIAITDSGDLIVGDSSTRDVYRIAAGQRDPVPLTGGNIGIPMSIAIAGDEMAYVADLETQRIVRLDLVSGQLETFATISVRGLQIDDKGDLWAVAQQKDQLVKFDSSGKATVVVEGRPMRFPHNLVFGKSGEAFVTDGYSKAIWQISEGKIEKWLEGDPLVNPVGIAREGDALLVADPRAKSIFRISIADKQTKPLQPAAN